MAPDRQEQQVSYRGVLIGCGFFAQNHLHAWAGLDGAGIVAVCDSDAQRARDTAERFGIPRHHTDAASALAEESPDFVDIATTAPSHRALVEVAAPHARLVICQKPMAETQADAAAMVAACEASGAHLLIHENFRWQRPFRVIAERLAAIGPIHFARFSFRHGYDNYVNQPYLAEIERFTIMDVGLHLFDLARHLVGEVATIDCRTQRLNPRVRGEDAFTALLGHQDGAVSVVDCSFWSRLVPHRFPQTLAEIEGAEGTLVLTEDYQLTIHGPGGREAISVEPPVPSWGAAPWHIIQDSVIALQAHAVDVLSGAASPAPSGAHNLRTLTVGLAAYESAASGRVVRVDDWREGAG
jgi:predicted dehydrogenase